VPVLAIMASAPGGRPAGQRVDLLPLLPRRDRPVATRAAGPASEGSPCNCIGNAGRTVRGGGALPAAQLRGSARHRRSLCELAVAR